MIDKIISEPNYNDIINSIKENTSLEIEDMDYQMKMIFEKSLSYTKLKTDELIQTLKNDKQQLINYILKFYSVNIDESQEYDEGEELVSEEEDDILEDNSTSSGVVINFLIDYCYLSKKNLKDFDDYLKKKRIPHRKKYIKELQEIYSKI